jgi:hypothetical protein
MLLALVNHKGGERDQGISAWAAIALAKSALIEAQLYVWLRHAVAIRLRCLVRVVAIIFQLVGSALIDGRRILIRRPSDPGLQIRYLSAYASLRRDPAASRIPGNRLRARCQILVGTLGEFSRGARSSQSVKHAPSRSCSCSLDLHITHSDNAVIDRRSFANEIFLLGDSSYSWISVIRKAGPGHAGCK